MDVESARKAVHGAQDRIGTGQKLPHQGTGGRHGGVDRNDEILDAPLLPGLRRLDERHVAIAAQAVGVVDIVKRVGVGAHDLPGRGKTAQELAVVHIIPRGNGELFHHVLSARTFLGQHAVQGGL